MRRTFLTLGFLFHGAAHAASPYVLNWSSQSYGPDGPWQAVTIDIGSSGQTVALYPGATWASTILMDSICTNNTLSTTCYAARAGTYSRNDSVTAYSSDLSPWSTCYWNVQGGCIEGVIGDHVQLGGVTVPNVSFTGIYQTYQTYPNGREYPVSVGNLALGAPRLIHPNSGVPLNMIAAWLYTSVGELAIPSYSYGMHIGSVTPVIPGSLILGGYDKSRVVGEVSAQPVSMNAYSSGELQIELQDIGIGVAVGASPFALSSREGLFVQNNGAVLPRMVTIDPTKPYMYLPEATCDAITASLPVSFDTGLGLYFWDTTSQEYANITSSGVYLSFTFNKDGLSNQNFTVKVPMRLLALTLQDPLVEQNVTYFPCFLSTDIPVLGRPFLQAAFVGVNWFEGNNTGTWFMAQAPGPNLRDADTTAINTHDTSLEASGVTWEHTWEGHWHPLEGDVGAAGSHDSNNHLSTGAKVGIGIGVGLAGAIIIIVCGWVITLRHNRHTATINEKKSVLRGLSELPTSIPETIPKELAGRGTVHPHEMVASRESERYELG